MLAAKGVSLSNALAALQAELGDYVKQFSKAASSLSSLNVIGKDGDNVIERAQVEIVRRWFATYVRLHDGFVLLKSGKQWHGHNNNGNKLFSSRLKGPVCSNGYTHKFKSERGYTRWAYNKAYNPQVGIRAHRLLVMLSKLDGQLTEVTMRNCLETRPLAVDFGRNAWTSTSMRERH